VLKNKAQLFTTNIQITVFNYKTTLELKFAGTYFKKLHSVLY
jgi:hypothetical protein